MKRIVAIAIAIATVNIGCSKYVQSNYYDNAWTRHGNFINTKVVVIEDHRYVILTNSRGVSIVHAESCPCKR